MKKLIHRIRENSWPIGIAMVIAAFVTLDGALVFTAFSDKTIAPEDNYYDKAVRYDELRSASLRTSEAGWKAEVGVAEVPLAGMPRRVDLTVRDRGGRPVTGLKGTMTAVRPADARLENRGDLIEVPGQEGVYRLLLKVPARGLWEFQIDARRGVDAYRMVVRQDVAI